MMKELSFAIYSIKKNIQSSAELRASFLMNIVGMAINNTAFIILWGFFVKSVGVIGGWTVADIVGLQGFTGLSYGVVFAVAVGVRKLPEYVATGAFDRYMLSPKNLLLRVATSSFSTSALGDLVFGVTCLTIYSFLIHINFIQLMFLSVLVVFSSIMFLAATITVHSTVFLFFDSAAVTNGLFELFLTPSLFHGGAFQGAMRFVFTFIIPSLIIGALPVEALRSISLVNLAMIGFLSLGWFALSIYIFNKAVRRYESSNLMTFGS